MTLHESLERIFQMVFGDDELTLTDEMTMAEIEGWDSVAHVNLMFGIENELGVRFAGNEMAEIRSVGALKTFLAERL